MKEAKVAVKYCGGCNPTFVRKKVVSQIERYFEIEFKPYDEKVIPDIVIIVNGCKSECIDISRHKSKGLTILINDNSQVSDVITAMKMIMEDEADL